MADRAGGRWRLQDQAMAAFAETPLARLERDDARWLPRIHGSQQRQRAMVALRHEGLSYQAIAARTGLSVERARQVLARCVLRWMHETDAAWREAYHASRPSWMRCWCRRDGG